MCVQHSACTLCSDKAKKPLHAAQSGRCHIGNAPPAAGSSAADASCHRQAPPLQCIVHLPPVPLLIEKCIKVWPAVKHLQTPCGTVTAGAFTARAVLYWRCIHLKLMALQCMPSLVQT